MLSTVKTGAKNSFSFSAISLSFLTLTIFSLLCVQSYNSLFTSASPVLKGIFVGCPDVTSNKSFNCFLRLPYHHNRIFLPCFVLFFCSPHLGTTFKGSLFSPFIGSLTVVYINKPWCTFQLCFPDCSFKSPPSLSQFLEPLGFPFQFIFSPFSNFF